MLSLWHKALFVHIPKCGGQSVESTILADIGLKFSEHRRLMLCHERPDLKGWEGPHRLAHLKAREYFELDYITRELFDRLYRFAIVRNPFKKLESHWKFRFSDIDFESFVMQKLPELRSKKRQWVFASQADYLCDSNGELLVPNLFRLESIAADFGKIQEATGIKHPLMYVNRSEAPVAKPVWTEQMADQVRDLYSKDFQLLGYSDKTPAA